MITAREILGACNFTDDEIAAAFEALKEIARQSTSDELNAEQQSWADYTFAYDACVVRARAALKDKP
jgi:hypothetical protein